MKEGEYRNEDSVPYLFISFSSQDLKYVRELMAGLKVQGVDFWDYSDFIQEIELGTSIPERLQEELRRCDFFVPLVSANSMDPEIGRFTRFEVQYAIDLGLLERRRIIPVVIHQDLPAEWPDPYNRLENTVYEEIDLENVRAFEHMMAKICQHLGKIYQPLIEAHSRLPFWELFRDEVLELKHSRSSHVELMILLTEFNEHFQMDDWMRAYFLISHFISSCQYSIPDYGIFYPWIVKGVCQQQLGHLKGAEESFLEAGKTRSADENVFGGLGSVYFARQDYSTAKEFFKKALDVCSPDQNDDEKLNYVVALLTLEEDIPIFLQNSVLGMDFSGQPEERFRLMKAQGMVHYRREEYDEALVKFQKIEEEGLEDTPSVYYHHLTLLELGRQRDAIATLERALKDPQEDRIDTPYIRFNLSKLYLETDRVSKALKIYRDVLLKPEHRTRFFMIQYARIFKAMEDGQKVEDICREILGGQLFPPPKTASDYYFDGFAQYLLGNIERARYDFERSSNFDFYYSEFD